MPSPQRELWENGPVGGQSPGRGGTRELLWRKNLPLLPQLWIRRYLLPTARAVGWASCAAAAADCFVHDPVGKYHHAQQIFRPPGFARAHDILNHRGGTETRR